MKHTNKTHLLFPSMKQLWDFAKSIDADYMEISTTDKALICTCAPTDIQRAINEYGAMKQQAVTVESNN
jgi:hypothetical protein